MKPEDRDRLVRVEEAAKSAHHRADSIESDLKEIKASIKALEEIAVGGKGAFKSALFIGGVLGWIMGIGVSIWHVLAGYR